MSLCSLGIFKISSMKQYIVPFITHNIRLARYVNENKIKLSLTTRLVVN